MGVANGRSKKREQRKEFKEEEDCWMQWCTSIIPVTQESEAEGSEVQGQPQ